MSLPPSPEEVPAEALPVTGNSSGFPMVDLRWRNGRWVHASSRVMLSSGLCMIGLGFAVCLLPWTTATNNGWPLKYFVAGGLAWGGLCILIGYAVRNVIGQTLYFQPGEKVTIRSPGSEQSIPWAQLVGVQLCPVEVKTDREFDGVQLNLVWREEGGQIRRRCLTQHSHPKVARDLAERYQSALALEILEAPVSRLEKAGN